MIDNIVMFGWISRDYTNQNHTLYAAHHQSIPPYTLSSLCSSPQSIQNSTHSGIFTIAISHSFLLWQIIQCSSTSISKSSLFSRAFITSSFFIKVYHSLTFTCFWGEWTSSASYCSISRWEWITTITL